GLDRDARASRKSARQLAKRLRKALVGYVRAAVRSEGTPAAVIAGARGAALDELGLSRAVTSGKTGEPVAPAERALGEGLSRGLHDLVADWHEAAASDARVGGVHLSHPMISLDLTFGRIFRRLARRTERKIQRTA